MKTPVRHSRRAILRGTGAMLALPFLESAGFRAWAKPAPAIAPRRLGFVYFPNGVNVEKWKVRGENDKYVSSPTLKSLAEHREDTTIISGLAHEKAMPGKDGGGAHARATSTYLTGVRVKKTGGNDIRAGVSIDQLAAMRIGHRTRLPSLELTTDGIRSSGTCDSGYTCAYQYNLSWKTPTLPQPAERHPRAVFERLFSDGVLSGYGRDSQSRRALQKSVLDYVLEEARSLGKNLTAADRDKMDQYFESVRHVERRIEKTERQDKVVPHLQIEKGIPDSYREHIRIMYELMLLAFQTDSTRIATFMLSHDGSNRSFPEIGVPEAHHQISHHKDDPEKLRKIALIDRFYIEEFGRFLTRMKAVREGESSLLDNSMLVYGGCISEGNKHWHNDLPIVLAGGRNADVELGRHLQLADPTPMSNLLVALAQKMELPVHQFGDSTGALPI